VGEVEALKGKENFYFFAIDADSKIRYERIKIRNNESDNVTYEKFIDDEQKEMQNEDPNKQNVGKCIKLADYTFTNN
jgi:dephospho-CoA kinase